MPVLPLLLLLAGCVPAPVRLLLHDECGPDDVSTWPEVTKEALSPVGRLAPFVLEGDHSGPASTIYGKAPEVVAVADALGIDVLLQDYGGGATGKLVRIDRDRERFVVTQILDLPTLDRVMGLARDDEGYRYVASGVSEGATLTDEDPPPGEYREGIVHVDKIDPDGQVVWTVDLDTAREATGVAPELVINPMVAATSRLAWGDGRLALLHGINTDFDGAVRHQKALTTHLDAETGVVTRTAGPWVSHSFDQRLLFDGEGFVELHLGDAYPRQIVLARIDPDSQPYPVLHNKGTSGDNNTYARLGGLALVPPEVSADIGYQVVFSAESDSVVDGGGAKNVGLVRIRRDFHTADPAGDAFLDPTLPDTLASPVDGVELTNHLQWLTDYTREDGLQAERPSIVGIGCGVYVVLWEQWTNEQDFQGTWGVVVDAAGEVLVAATRVTALHIPRGDDLFELDNTAAWISADADGALHVNRVYADLSFTQATIE